MISSMMTASPEFYQPAFAPACTPRLLIATTEPTEDDDHFTYKTLTGTMINYLGDPATCPPARMRPCPPASVCRKRLFAAADITALHFDETILRPASLSDGKQRRRSKNKLSGSSNARRTV